MIDSVRGAENDHGSCWLHQHLQPWRRPCRRAPPPSHAMHLPPHHRPSCHQLLHQSTMAHGRQLRVLLLALAVCAALATRHAPAGTAVDPATAPAASALAPLAVPSPPAGQAPETVAPKAAVVPASAAAAPRGKHLSMGCIVPLSGPRNDTGRAVEAAIQMAIRDYAPKLPGVQARACHSRLWRITEPTLRCKRLRGRRGGSCAASSRCMFTARASSTAHLLPRAHRSRSNAWTRSAAMCQRCGVAASWPPTTPVGGHAWGLPLFSWKPAGPLVTRLASKTAPWRLVHVCKCPRHACPPPIHVVYRGPTPSPPPPADVIVGDVCSAASLGALGAINKYKIPLVSPASASPALSIPGDFFFRWRGCPVISPGRKVAWPRPDGKAPQVVARLGFVA
jgi:hypothetical protein